MNLVLPVPSIDKTTEKLVSIAVMNLVLPVPSIDKTTEKLVSIAVMNSSCEDKIILVRYLVYNETFAKCIFAKVKNYIIFSSFFLKLHTN